MWLLFFNPFQSIIHIETRVNFLQYNTNHVIPELRIQQFPNTYKIKHSKLESYILYCSTPASPKSYVPGTIPNVLYTCELPHITLTTTLWIISLILQMRKLQFKQIKSPAQGPTTASEYKHQDSN